MDQQFVAGMTVFDADGEKVGALHEYDPQGGYLLVQKGWLFPKDLYVPIGAVERNDADGIYLNLHKDDLHQHAYDEPPQGYAGAWSATIGRDSEIGHAGTGTRHAATQTTIADTDDLRVPVLEEELVVGKRTEEIGRVHIHKDVVTEQQTVGAPLTHEEVYVERVPAQGQYAAAAPDAFMEKDIDIPVMGEELIVGKQAFVAEEVHVHKDTLQEQHNIAETVRKEHVDVEEVDRTQ